MQEGTWPARFGFERMLRMKKKRLVSSFFQQGTIALGNGAIYTGSFERDEIRGAGKMRLGSGDVLSGSFVNGLLTGEGTIEYQTKKQRLLFLFAEPFCLFLGTATATLSRAHLCRARAVAQASIGRPGCSTSASGPKTTQTGRCD